MKDYVELRRTVNSLHHLVWDFREDYGHLFKTPDRLMSLHFAEAEIGAARDAWIRAQGTEFSRATQRQRQLNHALCQTLMMLLTAFPDYEPAGKDVLADTNLSWVSIHISSAAAFCEMARGNPELSAHWENFAWLAITGLVELIENPYETMAEVIAEIYTQRVAPALRMA